MPRRFQSGKLLVRGKRPYWYIKVSVPVITADGPKKAREEKILGFCDEMKRKDAEKKRSEILEAVNSHKVMASANVKFSEVAERFRKAELPLLGVAARARYESNIKVHLLPAFGEMRLSQIDTLTVQEWLNTKMDLSWWSRQGMNGVLGAMFGAAERWHLVDKGTNPTEGIRLGKKKLAREKRKLTIPQLQGILGAVQERERLIITVLFALGLRISECLGLKWKDIDWEKGLVSIERRWYRGDIDETKTEKSERVLALGPLVDEFKRRYPGPQAADTFVFDDGGLPPDDRDLLRWNFRPVLKALKLYYLGFGWHAFRRENITLRQTLGGATPMEASKAAGHSSMDMSLEYFLDDHARQAEQVSKMLGALYQMPTGGATKQ